MKTLVDNAWNTVTFLDSKWCEYLHLPVGRSVFIFLFLYDFIFFLPHCSCLNGLVTSNMAPTHPNATLVAVYPALEKFSGSWRNSLWIRYNEKIMGIYGVQEAINSLMHCIYQGPTSLTNGCRGSSSQQTLTHYTQSHTEWGHDEEG